jgi:hypothetical protein
MIMEGHWHLYKKRLIASVRFMLVRDLLEEGVLLFNSGKFYEAHEVWEDLWRGIEDPLRKTCCQGLIQAAVGLHHLGRANTVGARSQLQKSIRNLQRGSEKLSELNIAALVGQLTGVLDDLPDRVPTVVIARLK